jgi:ADP-heptose:LPS heptosyltransferase
LGDFILWLPAAKTIRANWPWSECRYVLVANQNWSQFAKELGLFDTVLPLSRERFQRNLFYRFTMIFRLARMNAELVITPIHSRDATTSDTVARAINAARKIAPTGDSNIAHVKSTVSDFWYTELVPTRNQGHETTRNKEFTEKIIDCDIGLGWPELAVPSSNRLPDELKGKNYVVLAPGASSPLRTWPPEFFYRLTNRLSEEMSLGIVLIGTASERAETKAVAERCSHLLIDLTAKLDINRLLAVLGHAKLIITNETGTAHLAAALRIPTVCITGGGHFGRFLPYPKEAGEVGIRVVALHNSMPCFNCNWECIYPVRYFEPAPCVSKVSIDAAWTAINGLMGPNT